MPQPTPAQAPMLLPTETGPTLSRREIEILQHSLGLDRYGRGSMYRNHYVAGGEDAAICRRLVAVGMMLEGRATPLTGGDPLFFVSMEGKHVAVAQAEILPPAPKLSRSQRRYRQWVHADCGLSFREWLKTPYARVS